MKIFHQLTLAVAVHLISANVIQSHTFNRQLLYTPTLGETVTNCPRDSQGTTCQCNPESGPIAESCKITCIEDQGLEGKCEEDTLLCRAKDDCNIICNGKEVCKSATLDASEAINTKIECSSGANSWDIFTCRNADISCGSGDCDIICNGEYSCAYSKINGLESCQMNVDCSGQNACASSSSQKKILGGIGDLTVNCNDSGCDNTVIDGSPSRDVTVNCDGTCTGKTIITCGSGDCTLNCNGAAPTCENVEIDMSAANSFSCVGKCDCCVWDPVQYPLATQCYDFDNGMPPSLPQQCTGITTTVGPVTVIVPPSNPSNPCITSCDGLPSGDYQSCNGCDVYATCSNGILYDDRKCQCPGNDPSFQTFWDDQLKVCTWESTTCPAKKHTKNPTTKPTKNPSKSPTKKPSKNPTENPTKKPTKNPTKNPTENPTENPTKNPTKFPTEFPSKYPTVNPTYEPTSDPTMEPSFNPTVNPTVSPTKTPTNNPTESPVPNCEPVIEMWVHDGCAVEDIDYSDIVYTPLQTFTTHSFSVESVPSDTLDQTVLHHMCTNTETDPYCVSSCDGMPSGDYQSCNGCDVYATCSNGVLTDNRKCPCPPNEPNAQTYWDDHLKVCAYISSTCVSGSAAESVPETRVFEMDKVTDKKYGMFGDLGYLYYVIGLSGLYAVIITLICFGMFFDFKKKMGLDKNGNETVKTDDSEWSDEEYSNEEDY